MSLFTPRLQSSYLAIIPQGLPWRWWEIFQWWGRIFFVWVTKYYTFETLTWTLQTDDLGNWQIKPKEIIMNYFNGIPTFMAYLIPKPSLFSKEIIHVHLKEGASCFFWYWMIIKNSINHFSSSVLEIQLTFYPSPQCILV